MRAQSVKTVRDDDCQTTPQTVVSSTPNLRKQSREPTMTLQVTATMKPEVKRPKTSTKEEK